MSGYICLFLLVLGAHTWPMFQKDIKHSGRTDVVGPDTSSVLWSFNLGAISSSSPVIAEDGTIYIGTTGGYLFAINPDGNEKWSFSTGTPVNSSPVILDNGDICCATSAGVLINVDQSGEEQWRFSASGQFGASSSPIVDGSRIYIASDSNLYSINVSSGNPAWTYVAQGSIDVSPVKSGSNTYIQTWWPGPHIVRSVSSSGSGGWGYETGGGTSSPTVHGNTIYVGSNDSYLYSLTTSGNLNNRTLLADKVTASPAITSDGHVLVGTWAGTFHSISPSGSIEWTFNAGSPVKSSAAVDAAGRIYFGCGDSTLYCLTPEGEEYWSFKAGHQFVSSPALGADGTLYCASWDRNLYAIGPGGSVNEYPVSVQPWQSYLSDVSLADGSIKVNLSHRLDHEAELRLIDISGRTLQSISIPVGCSQGILNRPSLSAVMFVVLQSRCSTESAKIVVLK